MYISNTFLFVRIRRKTKWRNINIRRKRKNSEIRWIKKAPMKRKRKYGLKRKVLFYLLCNNCKRNTIISGFRYQYTIHPFDSGKISVNECIIFLKYCSFISHKKTFFNSCQNSSPLWWLLFSILLFLIFSFS